MEGGTRVPYLIYVPCWIKRDEKKRTRLSQELISFPRCFDLAGIKNAIPSGSLMVKVLTGLAKAATGRRFNVLATLPAYGNQRGEPNSTIRKGEWKLDSLLEDGTRGLYKLAEDLEEAEWLKQKPIPKLVHRTFEELMAWVEENLGAKLSEPRPEILQCRLSSIVGRPSLSHHSLVHRLRAHTSVFVAHNSLLSTISIITKWLWGILFGMINFDNRYNRTLSLLRTLIPI